MHEETIPDAEKHLPRNICPLIKSSYGFGITEKCPYFYFSDMLIGETTCDGKKKMYEILGKIKPMHVVYIPQTPEGEQAYRLYRSEMVRDAKRILVTGSPLGDSTEKVIKTIEENGGVVVCFENCSSAKDMDDLVDELGDPIDALTRRYINSGCACMSPNRHRKDMIESYIDEYKIDGVVDVILQSCHTYNVETAVIKKVASGKGTPYMSIETDYSQSDVGQLSTRIGAFIEML